MTFIWRWVCCLACLAPFVLSFPPTEQGNRMYVSRTKQSDLESLASGYVFADLPGDQLTRLIEGLDLPEEFKTETTLRPMKTPPPPSKDFLLIPLDMEPEAEMLPAHYEGVKPPGVDHMELKAEEPDRQPSANRNSLLGKGEAAAYALAKQSSAGSKGARGREKTVDLERRLLDERRDEERRARLAQSAGSRRAHSDREVHAKGHKDASVRANGQALEVEAHREKGHNAEGFRNVYHKDEYRKDADFYDKGRQGAHFKKHTVFGDKHASVDQAFQNGAGQDSGYEQTEAERLAKARRTLAARDSQGHAALKGLDGFFDSLERFAQEAGAAADERLKIAPAP